MCQRDLKGLPSTVVIDSATAPAHGSMSRSTPTNDARGGLVRARVAAGAIANRVGARWMPAIPDAAKRLMARSTIIDGNVLDPTLQLTLAAPEDVRGRGPDRPRRRRVLP